MSVKRDRSERRRDSSGAPCTGDDLLTVLARLIAERHRRELASQAQEDRRVEPAKAMADGQVERPISDRSNPSKEPLGSRVGH